MTSSLLPLTSADYQPHALHSTGRIWTETNCYVDVWWEVLHSLGLDPMVAGAFAISTDFEGDQWTFFKYPEADLRRAYGIEVHEMNPWRGVLEHVVEQLELGRLMTVEADSYYLPDTQGVSYRLEHVKSTIVPNAVDVAGRFLGYFHNAGYFELTGADFDGVFHRGAHPEPALPPYTELIRLESMRKLSDDESLYVATRLLAEHVDRRPRDNPVERLVDRIGADLGWLRDQPPETFHLWAFATVRQCGACAESAGSFLAWLADHGGAPQAKEAAQHWINLAEQAKSLQYALARAARGRQIELGPIATQMAAEWDSAQSFTGASVRS